MIVDADITENFYITEKVKEEHIPKSIWRYVLAAAANGIVFGARDANGVAPDMSIYGADVVYLEVFDDPNMYLGKYKIVGDALVPYTPPPPPPEPLMSRELRRIAEYPGIHTQLQAIWKAIDVLRTVPGHPGVQIALPADIQSMIDKMKATDAKYP